MRVFILAIALMGLALPAFADCSPTHQATTSSDTVATTSTTSTSTPAPAPNSGG